MWFLEANTYRSITGGTVPGVQPVVSFLLLLLLSGFATCHLLSQMTNVSQFQVEDLGNMGEQKAEKSHQA